MAITTETRRKASADQQRNEKGSFASKRTPELEWEVLQALRIGTTRHGAAAAAKINHMTLSRWINSDPDFEDQVQQAEGEAEAKYVARIHEAAHNGTWQAAAWWLERRRSDDYARRERIDMNVDLRKQVEKAAQEAGITVDEVWAELRAMGVAIPK